MLSGPTILSLLFESCNIFFVFFKELGSLLSVEIQFLLKCDFLLLRTLFNKK